MRRLAESGAAQEELISIRGERFVIPVKAEHKRRVVGVMHGASSSGQTVFIEPMETIEQNNELVRLLEEEHEEVRRILLEMTRRIAERADEIALAAEILAEIELQFAKARFAEELNCVQPEAHVAREPALSEPAATGESNAPSSAFLLHNARHPLLDRRLRTEGSAAVPMSLELDST